MPGIPVVCMPQERGFKFVIPTDNLIAVCRYINLCEYKIFNKVRSNCISYSSDCISLYFEK